MARFFTLFAAVLPITLGSAHPAQRRDGSMDPVFASMFAEGNLQALEHSDGSTNDNLVIEKMLYTINALRYMHDAPPVKWNQTLQNYATEHANKCIGKHTGGPYGENLYLGGNNCGFAMFDDIEEKAWNAKGNPIATDIDGLLSSGHFFQTIWKSLESFGCGRVYCGENSDNGQGAPINSWMWICNFDTWSSIEGFAGNISKRTHDSIPAGWDVPENHVSFSSFPPIELPALSFPTSVTYLSGMKPVTNLGMTMTALPPDVIAKVTGVSGFGPVPTAGGGAAAAGGGSGHASNGTATVNSSPGKHIATPTTKPASTIGSNMSRLSTRVPVLTISPSDTINFTMLRFSTLTPEPTTAFAKPTTSSAMTSAGADDSGDSESNAGDDGDTNGANDVDEADADAPMVTVTVVQWVTA